MPQPAESELGRLQPAADLPHPLLRAELERIAGSALFRRSAQHVRFLRYLVEHSLAGQLNALREIVIGVDVFGRRASDFDPRRDAIVRVQACRLREKLFRFYSTDLLQSPVEIGLPVGSYVPVFRRRTAIGDPASSAARDLVERGQHFLHQGGEENLLRAIQRFELALREDTDYAPAHRGIARGWINMVGEIYRAPMPWIDYAGEALQRSLALEPDHPEALILLGSLRHRYDFDWAAARSCFERALALAPQNAFAHTAFGFHLILAGETDAAEFQLADARRLDPQYLNSRWHMVYLRLVQRRWAAVRTELTGLLDLMGGDFRVRGLAATIDLYTGRYREALAGFEAVEAAAPQHPVGLVGIAQASLRLGDAEMADRALAALRKRCSESYISPYQLALVEMSRGDPAAALRLLEEAAILRDSNVIFAPREPIFESLQTEARFASLLSRHRRKGRWGYLQPPQVMHTE